MQFSSEYQSLSHTLKLLKLQVIDSLPYVFDFVTKTYSAENLFKQLKKQVTFKNDPPGVEYIQSMQTLFYKNNGLGDCDCFSVAALASLYRCGFDPLYVCLAGKSKMQPTHIYVEVYDPKKDAICPFDLTNPIYNYERPYNFKQRIPFKI